MHVGRFCSSRQGGEKLVRVVRRGIRVPCWLDPPCKVKSNRFAVSHGYESPDSLSHHSLMIEMIVIDDDEHIELLLIAPPCLL